MGYTISEKELQGYLYSDRIFLIDLRTAQEYRRGHLPGAVNIPVEQLKDYGKIWKRAGYEMLVFYCERGNLSLRMAMDFSERGIRAVSLLGGIHSYQGRLV